MQSEAEPSLCRVCGSGLSSATAGIDAVITIKVDRRNRCTSDPPISSLTYRSGDDRGSIQTHNRRAQLPSSEHAGPMDAVEPYLASACFDFRLSGDAGA
jgi:hypothetical protein